MTPQFKQALESVVSEYYGEAKIHFNRYAFNKKPVDHVFKSMEVLRNFLTKNRKIPAYTLLCRGDHEIEFLNHAMNDLMDSLSLSADQKQWTQRTYDRILIHCLQQHPRTKEQILLKKEMDINTGMIIPLNEGKRMILARIRNMLLTQNI